MGNEGREQTASAWREHRGSILRYLRRRLPTLEQAEDLTQETFLRLHRDRPSVADERSLRAWLFRTAHRLVVDAYRSRRQDVPLDEVEPAVEKDPGASLRTLEPCIPHLSARLPERYRTALLWDLDGMPQQEIAKRQQVSLSGAKSRVQRARGLLQREFERCCHYRFDPEGVLVGVTSKAPTDPCP